MNTFALITPNLGQVSRLSQKDAPGEMALRRGLSDGEFVAFYQPQLSLKKNTVIAVEALARWRHPQQGLLTPAYFLDALERHGLLDELFLRLFEQGLVLRRKLACLNLPLNMSFNLHPTQLNNPMLIEAIKVLLRAHECPAQSITFEITETGTLELSSVVTHTLLQLKGLGCGLSMDDFGAGYSSLQRLCDMPFSELKLDASFVNKLDTHSPCKAVITHAIGLAEALDLSLVIEGVETPTQLRQLKAMGCSMIQGYAIAPPMAENALLPYLLDPLCDSPIALACV
jgi:EAL domain-containing protein (putative c-di-GMP-specific phosphodiesterase class I)